MAPIVWSIRAKNDLVAIGEFIAKDSPSYARSHVQRIRTRVAHLAKFPRSGRVVPEVGDEQVREVLLGNYRIIYLLTTEEKVQILTIHHAARLLKL